MKPAFAKSPPMTEAEMRDLYRAGQSVATIAGMAYRRNGISKAEVRRVIFGEGV